MGCNGSKQKSQAKADAGEKTLLQQKAADGKVAEGKKRALIVSTSSALMGDHKTGAWSEEICGPFYAFQDAGVEVTICSIAGGDVPIDEGSLSDQFKTENDKKMIESGSAPLKGTAALNAVDIASYDIVYFAGGHGTCVDFPTDDVGKKVSEVLAAGKVVATVCHGAMALVNAKGTDGEPVVKGKRIACFTDVEETQVGLQDKVPFLLETKLKELGATVEVKNAWSDQAIQDGNLVTGQNPQSSVSCAKLAISIVVPPKKKMALIVSTSAALMGEHKTGAWSEEICGPFYTFQDAGMDVTVCSVAGGDIPIDSGSLTDQFKTENDKKMIESGCGPLKATPPLASVDIAPYDIIFFAGGHGTCVDFPTDAIGKTVVDAVTAGKVVATVCHGAMALVNAKGTDGAAIVKGKRLACFTDAEETQVGLHEKVPFLLESKLKELGAVVESADPWSDKSVQDGNLVSGQNPQSSVSCAKLAISVVVPSAVEKATVATDEKVEEQLGTSTTAADEQKVEDVAEPVSEQKEGSPAKIAAETDTIVTESEAKTTVCC